MFRVFFLTESKRMKNSSVKMVTRAIKKHLPNKCLIMRNRLTTHCRHNEMIAAMNVKNVRSHRQNETDVVEIKKNDPLYSDDETEFAGNVSNNLKRKREFVDMCSYNERRTMMAGLHHDDFAI